VIWDLYDEKNDDSVDLSRDQIWGVLKTYHRDFTSVYNMLVTRFPGEREGIDRVFENHGHFADKTPGNARWDRNEPYRDSDGNKQYNAGEYFIDYADTGVTRDANETIGSATNYQRPDRRNDIPLPGHFIKVDNRVPFYSTKVSFPSNPDLNYELISENQVGLVYVGDIPPIEYDAQITITAIGVETIEPLSFSAEEFIDELPQSIERGYYQEHDFKVKGIPTVRPPLPVEEEYTFNNYPILVGFDLSPPGPPPQAGKSIEDSMKDDRLNIRTGHPLSDQVKIDEEADILTLFGVVIILLLILISLVAILIVVIWRSRRRKS
jgi:hypothetical protein